MAVLLDTPDHGLPVAPRHCFYDSDEEDQEDIDWAEIENVFQWKPKAPKLEKIMTLLVCATDVSAAFVKSYTGITTDPEATMVCARPRNVVKDRCFGGREEEQTVTQLHYIQNGGCVAIVTHAVNHDYCNIWNKKLMEYICPEEVLILTNNGIHDYMCDQEMDQLDSAMLMMSLQTRHWSSPPLAPYLTPPNTVTGQPAAVLTWCQLMNIPASLVVSYLSTGLTFKEQVLTFKHFASNDGHLSKIASLLSHSQAEKLIQNFAPRPRTDFSNLYT